MNASTNTIFSWSDRFVTIGRGGERDLEKARTCVFQANYHLIWAIKYRREILVGLVEVRLVEVLKMIAENHDYRLLAARVHDGNPVHLFVWVPPKVCISELVRVFKCVSA
jgi:putative transposase